MDAMVIVLGWAVLGLLALGFIGEFIVQPWREEKEKRERKSKQPESQP